MILKMENRWKTDLAAWGAAFTRLSSSAPVCRQPRIQYSGHSCPARGRTLGCRSEFNAEINVHFPGLKNLDNPAVFVFPKLLLCLDCGFTEFTLRESELHLLDETQVSEMQGLQK